MKYNFSILINSCDSYHDVIPLNLHALNEYWPESSNIEININSESFNHHSGIFKIINLNQNSYSRSDWGFRFINCLSRIKEDFILVLLDDYVLEKRVDNFRLENILEKMVLNQSISCFYLNYGNFSLDFNSDLELHVVNKSNYFLINTGPAIWRKSDLLKLLKCSDNPWAWEFFSKYRKSANNLVICSVPNESQNIYDYNYNKGGAIYRGKWVEEVVKDKILKYKLSIDINKRGFAVVDNLPKRSFFWKINFFFVGFKMVKFRAFNLFLYYFREIHKKYKSN